MACLDQIFGGELCEETVSVVFVGEFIPCQKDINHLLQVSISSFWCVWEFLRIKNCLIGEGKWLFGQNNFFPSPLSVKSSWLINHVFPELGRPFRIWANLLVVYDVSLLVFLIWVSNPVHKCCQKSGSLRFCLYHFEVNTSLFAIDMDFAHRYINMRRIIHMYIRFYKKEGRGNLSSKTFNGSFFSLILK